MKILLSLQPKLHIADDRVATEAWFQQCHALAMKKEKLPSTQWALEEWEDFEEKNSSSLKYMLSAFIAEVKEIYLAFLSVRELAGAKDPVEAWRLFDQVLQETRFKGDFSGHPVMGRLHKQMERIEIVPRPGATRYDLIHPLPNGEKAHCPMYLDDKEVEKLKESSPKAYLSLDEFKAQSTVVMGLKASQLEPKVLLREGLPSYLRVAIEGVHAGRWKWKAVQQAVALGVDRIAVG